MKRSTTKKSFKSGFPRRALRAALFCGAAVWSAAAPAGLTDALVSKRSSVDIDQPCFRSGRCDTVSDERIRMQRRDRLAPQAPENPAPLATSRPGSTEITPIEHLAPAYRQTGTIRDEYSQSGQLR